MPEPPTPPPPAPDVDVEPEEPDVDPEDVEPEDVEPEDVDSVEPDVELDEFDAVPPVVVPVSSLQDAAANATGTAITITHTLACFRNIMVPHSLAEPQCNRRAVKWGERNLNSRPLSTSFFAAFLGFQADATMIFVVAALLPL